MKIEIPIKNIEWIEGDGCIYGDISGIQIFTIEYYEGYYEIYSSYSRILYEEFKIKKEYFEKKFRKLENAKKYCVFIIEKFIEIFLNI